MDSQSEKRIFYSKQGLLSLFIVAALPTHVWTIILILQDFAWVSERTNAWDAVGVGAYGLLFAFFESSLYFLAAIFLGVLIVKKWEQKKRIALLSLLLLITLIWAILGQLYFLLHFSLPNFLVQLLSSADHPLRYLYIAAFIAVAISVILPTYFVLQTEKITQSIHNLIERITPLTVLYLIMDVVSFFIVVIRNI